MQPCKVAVLWLDLELVICKIIARSSRLNSPPSSSRQTQQNQLRPGSKQLQSDVKLFQQRLPWPSRVLLFHNRLLFCTSAKLSILSRYLSPLKIIMLGAMLPLSLTTADNISPRHQGELQVSWVLTAGTDTRTSEEWIYLPVPELHLQGAWERCQLSPSFTLPKSLTYISFNKCLKPMTIINKKHQ